MVVRLRDQTATEGRRILVPHDVGWGDIAVDSVGRGVCSRWT
jgi:hypothetical protein